VNGFQRDVIKAAKAFAYAHRATRDFDKEDPDFRVAVEIVAMSIDKVDQAVEALELYEDSKKK